MWHVKNTCAVTFCITMQHTATRSGVTFEEHVWCKLQQDDTTYCNNMMQLTATTCCHVLQQHATKTSYNVLQQHATTYCNNMLDTRETMPHCNTLHHTATYCNTLQHTATHCNAIAWNTRGIQKSTIKRDLPIYEKRSVYIWKEHCKNICKKKSIIFSSRKKHL